MDSKSKKKLDAAKAELKRLMAMPLPGLSSAASSAGSIVTGEAGSGGTMSKNKKKKQKQEPSRIGGANKRSGGLFVFAK